MRKDQIEILTTIQKIEKNQIYLLEEPKTPQQQFLHLFAHRHLIKQKMLNKNIDNVMDHLQGSFAQSSLKLAYTTLCIQNRIQLAHQYSPLLGLIQGWISFYSTINSNNKLLMSKIIHQQHKSIDIFNGYDLYLTYLNLISVDLWKLIKNKKDQNEMFANTAIKAQIRLNVQSKCTNLDATDLLNFVNSCFPNVLLNIILKKQTLPHEMRSKFQNYECLFSNQSAEYFLRTSIKLSYLLKHIFVILLSLELNKDQQKALMMVAFKYYYIYHYDKRFSASQIIIHSYNKVNNAVKMTMNHQFIFFCRIISKLGKSEFLNFIAKSSDYMKRIIQIALKQPIIGYPQESLSPYNSIGVGQIIQIGRGLSVNRTFEVFEQNSIFFFKIIISSLDLTVRLYYLGEIGSQKAVKIPLLTHEKKSGQLRQSVNAMKKGLYMFQFDNTYSWINGKTINYETVVLTPLQIVNESNEEWVYDFYENLYQNQVEDDDKVQIVTNKAPNPKALVVGTAAVSKNLNIFSLKVNRKQQQYIYQTDNSQKFKNKISEVVNEKQKYQWTLLNKVVKQLKDINNFIGGIDTSTSEQKRQQKHIQKKRDPIQDHEEDEDIQYQVVEKDTSPSHALYQQQIHEKEQSLLMKEEKKAAKQLPKKKEQKRTAKEQPKKKEEQRAAKEQPEKKEEKRVQKQQPKKKEIIDYNSAEQSSFYQ